MATRHNRSGCVHSLDDVLSLSRSPLMSGPGCRTLAAGSSQYSASLSYNRLLPCSSCVDHFDHFPVRVWRVCVSVPYRTKKKSAMINWCGGSGEIMAHTLTNSVRGLPMPGGLTDRHAAVFPFSISPLFPLPFSFPIHHSFLPNSIVGPGDGNEWEVNTDTAQPIDVPITGPTGTNCFLPIEKR